MTPGMTLEPRPSLHLEMRQDLEARLDELTYLFRDSSENITRMWAQARKIFQKTNPSLDLSLLDQVFFILNIYIRGQRNMGELEIAHSLRAGLIAANKGADTYAVAVVMSHDLFEYVAEHKELQLDDAKSSLHRILDDRGVRVVGAMSSYIKDNPVAAKAEIANQVNTLARGDYEIAVLGRASDGVDNTRTSKFMGSKNGESAEERQRRYLSGIEQIALPYALIADKIWANPKFRNSRLKLYRLMKEFMEDTGYRPGRIMSGSLYVPPWIKL